MTYKRNIKTRSRNHYCREKTISITYSQCVSVTLVMKHAKLMRRIILSSVACLAVSYFSRLSINSMIVGKELLDIRFVFFSRNFM
jgi:hypothetical protein